MAELLSAGAVEPPILRSGRDLTVEGREGCGIVSVHVRQGARASVQARLQERYGVLLPEGPRRTVAQGLTVLGTGPAAFLAIREAAELSLAAELSAELSGVAAVVDQSSAYALLHLSGARAREVLQAEISIDLHPSVFSTLDVAVTGAAGIGLVLWRAAETSAYVVAVQRSLRESFTKRLPV